MASLAPILHEIAHAFGTTTSLRGLTAQLGMGLAVQLPLVEVETVTLLASGAEVSIVAYAPVTGRWWQGRRSARCLARQGVVGPIVVRDELARVAEAPIQAKLKLPVGEVGLLSLAWASELEQALGGHEAHAMVVDALTLGCLRLGQLLAVGRRCRAAHRQLAAMHRNIGVPDGRGDRGQSSTHRNTGGDHATGEKLDRLPPGGFARHRNIGDQATAPSERCVEPGSTEIPVMTLAEAQRRCIQAALAQTGGKLYGDDGAAALLGLKPSTLQSKMIKLGIERSRFARPA